jgi:hypothetical protein
LQPLLLGTLRKLPILKRLVKAHKHATLLLLLLLLPLARLLLAACCSC